MLNVLLIDDNQKDVEYFITICKQILRIRDIKVVNHYNDAIFHLQEGSYDIVFWEISLDSSKIFSSLKTFHSLPPIIALTHNTTFALQAFEAGFTDYITKPYTFERLMVSINRAYKQNQQLHNNKDTFIFFKVGRSLQKVEVNDILYGEACGIFTKLYLKNSDFKLVSCNITEALYMLPQESFKRVHKSFFINFNKIELIDNKQIKVDTITLPLSKTYRNEFERLLSQL